ncbi:LTXXQ motif family protein [Malaciobacter marinus]|jgi:Spy/CpxP family protein refolding chaperone|uniref:LTXXQ motif family protein n=1 Tax=Malaciobacter marinus TaxID=505249 RepID=A0AB36ZZ54_9BACT|nr:Spy/CpxP family protein refolding chaperone [Malaciobacter marinus]PPK62693.1 LTXXQ motif family protein [Malaciobacter marinus]
MKILRVFIILVILNNLTLFAKDSNHIYKNLDFLNLNKSQQHKLKKILISHKKRYEKFYYYKQHEEKKLQELIKKDYFDEDKYEDIAEEIEEEAVELEVKTLKKIHKILTKEQRKKFSHYLQEWKVE